MIITESLFALAVSLFLTAVFAVVGRQAKSARRVILFFLVVFLGAWAGGIWITPVGPMILGVYWLSFFGVGLVLALVLEAVAAFSVHPSEPVARDIQKDKREEREIEAVLGVFFWILVVTFIGAIVVGYIHRLR
jgi:MFS family permease